MGFPYSSGDVLTAADLNASSGLVFIQEITPGSSLSSLTITNVFDSRFENYHVKFSNFQGAAGGAQHMRMDNDTGSNYYFSGIFNGYNGTALSAENGAGVNFWRCSFTDTTTSSWNMDIISPNLSAYTFYHVTGSASGRTNGTGYTPNGVVRTTTQYTGFTLFMPSGTFSNGKLRIYGYNNG